MGLPSSAATSFAEELAQRELVVRGPRSGVPFNGPEGIALNPTTGEVVVANTNDHFVEVYSRVGSLLTRFPHLVWTPEGVQVEGLPRGVAVIGADRIVVADAFATYVDVVDYRGRSVARLQTSVPPGAGGLSAVAVTRGGAILAAGVGPSGLIHAFAPDFSSAGSWGVSGSAPGQLSGVTGLAELSDGAIAVTCAQTELAVQIFDPAGVYRRGFGRHDIGVGNFSLPSGVTATPDGRIWVSDELRQVVQVFTAEGEFLGMLGRGGQAPGEFLYPSALASADGRLAVTERVGARFQVFSIPGQGDRVQERRE
jgi:DNA-binding beta-propeller fold protein YncE